MEELAMRCDGCDSVDKEGSKERELVFETSGFGKCEKPKEEPLPTLSNTNPSAGVIKKMP